MKIQEEDRRAVSEYVLRLGHTLAERLKFDHNKQIRYFDSTKPDLAPCSTELSSSPSEVLQLWEDSAFAIGIAVLPSPHQSHLDSACAGFTFTVPRTLDGRIVTDGRPASFSRGCTLEFASHVGKELNFVALFR